MSTEVFTGYYYNEDDGVTFPDLIAINTWITHCTESNDAEWIRLTHRHAVMLGAQRYTPTKPRTPIGLVLRWWDKVLYNLVAQVFSKV